MSSDDGGQTPYMDLAGLEQDAAPGPTPPPGTRSSTEPPSGARNRRTGTVVLAGLAAAVAVIVVFSPASGGSNASVARAVDDTNTQEQVDNGAAERAVAALPVTSEALAALPQATTKGTVPNAPQDPAPALHTGGRIVHPSVTVPVYAAPGGQAIAALPPQQHFDGAVSDTSVPIIAEKPGWAQVLLPTRPNHSTGWIHLDDPAITTLHSPVRISVDRERFQLTLFRDDAAIGRWTIGVGKSSAVTPAGRTFVLGSILEEHPTYSPVILPLGAHSDTHMSFGGGPGTVGIHTWPSADVFGRAASDGCVRVPRDALDEIARTAPLGSVVEIS
ncbi:MAG TPA: L,D-transpeptidase [Pseudonocardiaceae bacterium]|jgi:lipoprotein-anchoring transpeptidase ErfK/SrfK